jgi:glycosyltransferase involved in cell wall biosynthesis
MNSHGITLLFVAHSPGVSGGAELSLLEIIFEAQRLGYTIHVTVTDEGDFKQLMEDRGIPCSVIHYGWWPHQADEKSTPENIRDMEALERFRELIEASSCDLVLTNTSTVPWGALTAALNDVPHIWLLSEFPVDRLAFLEDTYGFIDAFSNLVFTASAGLRDFVSSRSGRQDIRISRPYIDVSRIQLGQGAARPRVVNIGSRQPNKNQMELLVALRALYETFGLRPEALLIGNELDMSYAEALHGYATSNGMDDQVAFLPHQDNPYALLGPRDVVVQPSKSEAFSRVMVEVMKLGLIVVGADIPGTRESFSLGQGHLYPAGRPDELAELLHSLLSQGEDAFSGVTEAGTPELPALSKGACLDPLFDGVLEVLHQPNPASALASIKTLFTSASMELIRRGEEIRELHVRLSALQAEITTLRAAPDHLVQEPSPHRSATNLGLGRRLTRALKSLGSKQPES